MTICVAVKVAEGLVLAADSATTLEGTIGGQSGVLQTFEFANKIAHIKDYPIGVMSWGLGSIGERSIQSLIMEWEYNYPDKDFNNEFTVHKVGQSLLTFLKRRYSKAYPGTGDRPGLGLFVGGYSARQFFADEYIYEFPGSKRLERRRPDGPDGKPQFGADWFGLTDALTRLIKGFDQNALNELVNRGADLAIIQKWVADNVGELPLVFTGMPIQDAVDFANYAAQVVIGRYRFGVGPPVCGGDIDIAVITPDSFGWAQRKRWSIKE